MDQKVYNTAWHIKDVYRDALGVNEEDKENKLKKLRKSYPRACKYQNQKHPKLFYRDTPDHNA